VAQKCYHSTAWQNLKSGRQAVLTLENILSNIIKVGPRGFLNVLFFEFSFLHATLSCKTI